MISDRNPTGLAVSLREAAWSDARALLFLIQKAFVEYVGRIDPPSSAPHETKETLRACLEGGSAILAELDGAPVGCVFYETRPGHVYLYRLAVLPEYRRRGIGGKLVRYVENETLRTGLGCVRLGVRIALPQNLRYYKNRGYRVIEQRTHSGYSRPTFVIMEKLLDRATEVRP